MNQWLEQSASLFLSPPAVDLLDFSTDTSTAADIAELRSELATLRTKLEESEQVVKNAVKDIHSLAGQLDVIHCMLTSFIKACKEGILGLLRH